MNFQAQSSGWLSRKRSRSESSRRMSPSRSSAPARYASPIAIRFSVLSAATAPRSARQPQPEGYPLARREEVVVPPVEHRNQPLEPPVHLHAPARWKTLPRWVGTAPGVMRSGQTEGFSAAGQEPSRSGREQPDPERPDRVLIPHFRSDYATISPADTEFGCNLQRTRAPRRCHVIPSRPNDCAFRKTPNRSLTQRNQRNQRTAARSSGPSASSG